MRHLTALDGIRAIALFLVIVSHWLDKTYLVRALAPGAIGVDVFFVLSGFLITTILLQNKLQAEAQDNSKKTVVKNFFIRRSLRIFPVYYLFLVGCLVIGPITGTNVRQHVLYFLTYTSNFYFYQQQAWDGIVSHLWSLAVEEQFYLLWPWVILFTPRKYLLFSILLFISIGIGSSYVIMSKELGDFALTLPFSCFDAFGLGALLSFILVFHKNHLPATHRVLGIAAIICGIQAVSMQTHWPLVVLPDRTVYAIIALWLIAGVVLAQESDRKPSAFLTNPVLVFFGKISYGMYLFHLPLAWDASFLHNHINYRLPAALVPYQAYVVFAENMAVLIMASWASWVFFERPILRFKQYFDYQAREPRPVARAT